MKADRNQLTNERLRLRYEENTGNIDEIIQPIMELSENSFTLILGFAVPPGSKREGMIPYFHVVGRHTGQPPLRLLIISGLDGPETYSTYLCALLLNAIENRFNLVDGVEVTVFPFATRTVASPQDHPLKLWREDTPRWLKHLEHELTRYDYDLVIHIKSPQPGQEESLSIHPSGTTTYFIHHRIFEKLSESPDFPPWDIHEPGTESGQHLTPLPEKDCSPTEITYIPGDSHENATGLLLTLVHTLRDKMSK